MWWAEVISSYLSVILLRTRAKHMVRATLKVSVLRLSSHLFLLRIFFFFTFKVGYWPNVYIPNEIFAVLCGWISIRICAAFLAYYHLATVATKCSTYCVTGDKYSTLRQPMTSLYRHFTIATPMRNQCHAKLALELASWILCTAMKVRAKKSVSPALILKTTLLRSSSLNVVTCMIHPKWYSVLKSMDCATNPPPPPPSSTFLCTLRWPFKGAFELPLGIGEKTVHG